MSTVFTLQVGVIHLRRYILFGFSGLLAAIREISPKENRWMGMCEILNIADAIVILALEIAGCLPIRASANCLTLLRCARRRSHGRAQLASMPEYGHTTGSKLLLGAYFYESTNVEHKG